MTLDEGRAALKYCNSYNRLSTLRELWEGGGITTNDWLTLLGEEWTGCDDITRHRDWLVRRSPLTPALLGPTLRRFLMSPAELMAYDAMRGTITLWRGCYGNNKVGLSWSLDRAVAAKFTTNHRYSRPDGQPLLVQAEARRKDILALKLDRQEAEVIAWRPKVVAVTKLEIAAA